jgi:hypothetical protein
VIALLSGAKRNVGDHLITERARVLLETHLDEPTLWLPNWESLDGRLDELADVRLFVVAGGPGLRTNMYGGVYPLFSDPATFTRRGARLVFLGSGWKGAMGDAFDYRHQRFDRRTSGLLALLGDSARFSTRDHLSDELLRRQGIASVMTGCPVWYHLPSLGSDPVLPREIHRIVFTEPVTAAIKPQSLRLLQSLRSAYPAAEIVASFHHGYEGIDDYVDAVRAMGVETRDVAGDLSKIAFYEDFDLHVGYRVHAGLYFLSQRKPSLIVSEDARGRGSAEALDVPWVGAWDYTRAGSMVRRKLPILRVGRLVSLLEPREDVSGEVLDILSSEVANGWPAYRSVSSRIDAHYGAMGQFLDSIRGG